METIEVLVTEHDNILRLLRVIRQLSYNFMEGLNYDYADFYTIVDFIKVYSDIHHHKKEEDLLFKNIENLYSNLDEIDPVLGMYIEHDNARLFRANLQEALEKYKTGDKMAKLDIIANAISYIDLLERHIFKENSSIYVFAEKVLPKEIQEKLDLEIAVLENKAEKKGFQEKYKKILVDLETKYLKE